MFNLRFENKFQKMKNTYAMLNTMINTMIKPQIKAFNSQPAHPFNEKLIANMLWGSNLEK